jgi:3-dehydroquinate dehydratase-2
VRIGVLNGPNLNLLGEREARHYGTRTLAEIEEALTRHAAGRGVDLFFVQSNHEGELVDWIQERTALVDGWLVNAGALTHGSLAIRDALASSGRPFVELHLSNVFAREPFRRDSVLADLAIGVIAGFHERSYYLALDALVAHLGAGA